MPRKKGNLKIATRVARDIFKERFRDPKHHMYFDRYQKELAARKAVGFNHLGPLTEEEMDSVPATPGLTPMRLKKSPYLEDQIKRDAPAVSQHYETLPQGNASIAKAMPDRIVTPPEFWDDEGNPRPLRQRKLKDNRHGHKYLDTWVSVAEISLQRTCTKTGRIEQAWLQYGFDNEDPITKRVIGYRRRPNEAVTNGRVSAVQRDTKPGFPEVGSSLDEVFAWLGKKESSENALYVVMSGSSHLPPWEFMTEEQREAVLDYNPWKTELKPIQRMAVKEGLSFGTVRFPELITELDDDCWT